MFQGSSVDELKSSYEAGERDFERIVLRRANLQGLDLSNANFKGADFSYANLREVNFSGADLSDVFLNEADLTGANLEGANLKDASLIKTYLIKANLHNAKLNQAYLTGAYLTKSILTQADLSGAYLNGAKLSGAVLEGAFYDSKTHFDSNFLPKKVGMNKDLTRSNSLVNLKVTVQQLVNTLNHLSEISVRYLGSTMTVRYWEAARPENEWLKQFNVNRSAKIEFTGTHQGYLEITQLRWSQEWVNRFVKTCSQIIQDYHKIIDHKQVVFAIADPNIVQTSEKEKDESLMVIKSSSSEPDFTLLDRPTAEDLLKLF